MASSYTSLLGFVLPVTGELSGTWGDVWNASGTSLIESAIAGTTTLSTDGDVTLSTTTGAANQSRQAILLCSGARTALRTITAPAQSKIYTVINATTGGFSVKVVGAGPTTGVTIVAGESAVIAWNGSDFVKVSNTGGAVSFTDITVSGSATFSGGTANGVAYLNGSKVLTTGSALTFDGTNLGVAGNIASSGSPVIYSYNGGSAGSVRAGIQFVGTDPSIRSYISGSEQMRLTSTGLGIGTSSPATKIDIDNGATYAYGLTFQVSSQTARKYQLGMATGGVFALYDTSAAAQRLVVDTTGNLGLGVVPSAWNSAIKVVQIGAGVSLESRTANYGYMALSANQYINSSGVAIYLAADAATKYEQANGVHRWSNAPSGAAGDPITFTQAMTLDGSGNLGIGTTSPANFGKLSVVGTIAPVSPDGALQGLFLAANTGEIRLGGYKSGGGTYLVFTAGADTEKMRLTSTGLGIGLVPTSGHGALQVLASGATITGGAQRAIEIYDTGSGSGEGGAITFSSVTCPAFAAIWGYSSNPGGSLIFGTNTANTGYATERMRIDSSGNLGLGVSSPGDKLEIGGAGAGIILASPNGTRYRITVSNLGVLIVAAA